jgi:transcriptional regulator with XRE-family HTH domain
MEQCVRVRVGRRLKQARNEQGLTMAGLAEVLGVTEKSVTNYESGRRDPDWATLERIADATGRDLAWFFQDEGAAEPEPEPTKPDMPSLLAQLVAAQVQMLQAQARAEERADQRHGEMMQALTALTHEQMRTRAEAARMQRQTRADRGGTASPPGAPGASPERRARARAR